MNTREPEYKRVENESSLEHLVPGDRVRIFHYRKATWMVYQKSNHGEGKRILNSESSISFIEIPEGYNKESNTIFNIWKSSVRYLQFNGSGMIYWPSLHSIMSQVTPGSEQYHETKTLADLILF